VAVDAEDFTRRARKAIDGGGDAAGAEAVADLWTGDLLPGDPY
jgi:hypothetical protein